VRLYARLNVFDLGDEIGAGRCGHVRFGRMTLEKRLSLFYISTMELDKFMTSTEFATKIKQSYNTVLRWLRKGMVRGAVSQTLGNETRWFIPNERVADFRQWDPKKRRGKRGPAKKAAKKEGSAK